MCVTPISLSRSQTTPLSNDGYVKTLAYRVSTASITPRVKRLAEGSFLERQKLDILEVIIDRAVKLEPLAAWWGLECNKLLKRANERNRW